MYVFGGCNSRLGFTHKLGLCVYDPADSWKRLKDTPQAITHTGLQKQMKIMYLAGGQVNQQEDKNFYSHGSLAL